ncbi:MAG: hypothetical protein P8Z78_08160 [Gammaproteobacteria bacterium]
MSKSLIGSVSTAAVLLTIGLADPAMKTSLLVTDAEARLGRPVTPISYAGVARRTTRRAIIATSVYVATLPRGCQTVVVEGTTLYHCGSTYYRASGGRYVVVNVN